MAGRHAQQEAQWREMEVEKTVREEVEERHVKLISGETSHVGSAWCSESLSASEQRGLVSPLGLVEKAHFRR